MKRHRRRRTCAAGLLFALIAGCIAGCTAETQQEEAENKQIWEKQAGEEQTIIYGTWEDERAYTEKIIELFEIEHPEITVETVYISEDMNMTAEVALELMESEKIDVIGLKDVNDSLYLKEQGQVLDITDWIPESGIDVSCYGNMYVNISDEGKYYCLPYRKTCWTLAYNREIFRKEGLSYPEQMTWDEFADLALRLTKGSGEEKQWGCLFGNWVCDYMGIQERNYLFDDDLTYVQKGLELLERVYFTDQSSMTPEEIEEANWLEVFESGRVAMMPMGEWMTGMAMEYEKEGNVAVEWDFAPMPILEDQKEGTTWGTYQVAAVSTGSVERGVSGAAFEFLEYLCGKSGAKVYAGTGMLPAYIDEEVEELYRDATGNHNADVFFDAYLIQEIPVHSGYKELKDMLKEETEPLWRGEASAEEVMKQFENRRKEYYSESANE